MIDENYAHITCSCGKKIQVLKVIKNEDDTEYIDLDEEATSKLFDEHTCY